MAGVKDGHWERRLKVWWALDVLCMCLHDPHPLTLLKWSELKVREVSTKLGIAGRLLELPIRLAGVKLHWTSLIIHEPLHPFTCMSNVIPIALLIMWATSRIDTSSSSPTAHRALHHYDITLETSRDIVQKYQIEWWDQFLCTLSLPIQTALPSPAVEIKGGGSGR